MIQRFNLDRRSFEKFLAALSLVQQLDRQAAYQRALNDQGQPFLSLLQLQRAIDSGNIDLPFVMTSVVKLTQSVSGGNAAGIWLFRDEGQFSCYAQIGGIQDPDRLGSDILARLASSSPADGNSCTFSPTLRKASHYPGSPNSAAMAALRVNEKIVGAVAAFSSNFDAFASRDLDNLQFLAGLLQQALQKAMHAGYREAIALEHAALLKLLEQIAPQAHELGRQLATSGKTRIPEQIKDSSLSYEHEVYRRLPQQDPFSDSCQSAEIAARTKEPRATDISVPGVGVRAALGDVREFTGDDAPFFLWETLRNGSNRVRGLGAKCRSGVVRLVSGTALLIEKAAMHVAHIPDRFLQRARGISIVHLQGVTQGRANAIARITNWRLKVHIVGLARLRPSNWLYFDSLRLGSVRSSWRSLLRSVSAKSRTLLDNSKGQFIYLFRLTKVRARSLRREFRQKRTNISAIVAEQRMRVRVEPRRQKSMLTNSAEITGEALQHAGESLAQVATSAGHSTIAAFSTLKGQAAARKRPRLNPRGIRRYASAIGVLAIMAIFVALQASVRNSLEHVKANSSSVQPARVATPPPSAVVQPTVQPKLGPSSHLEITDASVADTLHDLTRYEIITLQRAADYGDDEAAFQLGMAYETGYYVRQSCSKAAHWVKVAAESGNSAAAYNLGLRYRTGDGLQVDESAAEHWLRMASARSYSPATLALASVR